MTATELRTLAPRLCRAYDQLLDAVDLAAHQARIASDELLSDDRCLAHRQLQLIRAGRSRSGDYKLERHRKLREIEQRREQSRARLMEARAAFGRAHAAVRAVDDPLTRHEPVAA